MIIQVLIHLKGFKFCKILLTPIFSDHNRIKLEVNNKLNNTLLHNPGVKEEIKRESRKYLSNRNENMTSQIVRHADQVRFTGLPVYFILGTP